MQLQHLYKGEKKRDKRDVYKKKITKQCVPWRCVTLHVLYTRLALKSILYMSFMKRKRREEKNDFRSSGVCGTSYFFLLFFVAYNLRLSLHFGKRCIKEMIEVTTQARLRDYSHEPSGALAHAAHGGWTQCNKKTPFALTHIRTHACTHEK